MTAKNTDIGFTPKALTGKLYCHIVQARGLAGKGMTGKSSPYVRATLNRQQSSTKVVKSNLNPIWSALVTFDVSSDDSVLSLTVFSKNKLKSDDFLGLIKVPISEINEDSAETKWYPLAKRNPKDRVTGEIRLKLEKAKPNSKVSMKDFTMVKVIGRGSFGKVQLVKKNDTGRFYALKTMKKKDLAARDEIHHIMSEKNILTHIDHPFVINLRFSWQTDSKVYLCMDYIKGGELFYHLKNLQRFSLEQTKLYIAEIAHVLGHLHSKGIIYRDLKPENILIDSEGHICLTDFGLCKAGLEMDGKTSTFCGTAEYLAPEVIRNQPYGRSVDWWALGILMYEMLFGLPPYYEKNHNVMYKRILTESVAFPPGIPADAKDMINRLLEKNPEARLGCGKGDFLELCNHPFLKDLDQEKVLKRDYTPVFIPEVSGEADTSNIDPEFLDEQAGDSHAEATDLATQAEFDGFTYTNQSEMEKS